MDAILAAGPMLWVHVGLASIGLCWALVVAILLALGWKFPPLVAVGPLLGHALAVVGGVGWMATGPAAVSATVGNGLCAAFAAPAAFVLGVGGLVAGVRSPRRWGAPIGGLLACALVAVLPLAALTYGALLPASLARTFLYGLATIPVALAIAGAHPDTNAREGAMIASIAWLSFVGSLEITTSSLGWSLGVGGIGSAESLAAITATVGGQATLGWVALVLAAAPAVLTLVRSDAERTHDELLAAAVNPSPWRWMATAGALLALPAWAFAMASVDPSAALKALLSAGIGE